MFCPPMPAQKLALPAGPCRYTLPGSHCLDPGYFQQRTGPPQFVGQWPFPRMPWAFETESRAPGTGLISGRGFPFPSGTTGFAVPCPCPPRLTVTDNPAWSR